MSDTFAVRANIIVDPMDDPVMDGLLVISGDTVLCVRPSPIGPVPEVVHDFSGRYVIPGLIDAHCHLILPGDGTPPEGHLARSTDEDLFNLAAANAVQALNCGVTTLRDLGSRGRVTFALREESCKKGLTFPRLFLAGRLLTAKEGHGHLMGTEVNAQENMVRAVHELAKEGADVIKVIASGGGTPRTSPWAASFSVEELSVLREEAHRWGLPITAHATCPDAIWKCLKARFDGIEHGGFWVDERLTVRFDPQLAEAMACAQIFLCPTLQASYRTAEAGIEPTEEARGRRRKMVADTLEICARLVRYDGIRWVAGSDAGYMLNPFGDFVLGLRLMVEIGLSPRQVLLAATRTAAQALRISARLGTLRPGRFADFVVLRRNPLDDISAVAEVEAVYLGGKRVR